MTKKDPAQKNAQEEVTSFLTTEPLSRRFQSPFDLVNYAVEIAEQALHTKRPSMLHHTIPNLSQQVLLEIVNDQDLLIEAAMQKAREEQQQREEVEKRAQQEEAEQAAAAEKHHAAKQRLEKRQQARASKAALFVDV